MPTTTTKEYLTPTTTTQRVPVNCFVEKLFCACGAEMHMLFATKKSNGLVMYAHACPSCSAFTEESEQYPKLVWEEKTHKGETS